MKSNYLYFIFITQYLTIGRQYRLAAFVESIN